MKHSQLPPLRDRRKTAKAKDRHHWPAVGDKGRQGLYSPGKLEKIGAAVLVELMPKTTKLLERYRDGR